MSASWIDDAETLFEPDAERLAWPWCVLIAVALVVSPWAVVLWRLL